MTHMPWIGQRGQTGKNTGQRTRTHFALVTFQCGACRGLVSCLLALFVTCFLYFGHAFIDFFLCFKLQRSPSDFFVPYVFACVWQKGVQSGGRVNRDAGDDAGGAPVHPSRISENKLVLSSCGRTHTREGRTTASRSTEFPPWAPPTIVRSKRGKPRPRQRLTNHNRRALPQEWHGSY